MTARVYCFLAGICLASLLASPVCARQSMTMGEAVQRALEVNFSITAAESESRAAESFQKSARGSFGPKLGTTYGWSKRQHKPTENDRLRDDDLYTWTVWLKQNVFAGFATLSSYQKAALQKENAQAGLDRARLELIATVQENFLRLIQARDNVRSARDSLARLESQVRQTRSFHSVGLVPRLDVLQTEVDLAAAENSLLQATNTYETQVTRLNTLLNIPAEEEVDYRGELAFLPFDRTFDDCLSTAYERRPDLIMAGKAVAMADKDVTIARSPMYPQVNAEANWSTQGDRMGVSGSTLSPTGFSSWNIGLSGEWTAFEWGETYYSVRQYKDLARKVRAEENLLRQEIAFDIKSRLLKIGEAAKRIKVSHKGVEQAQEAYRLARSRYQAQVGTFLDVLDAQSKLTMAEASLTDAQADYVLALSQIHAAMGEEKLILLPE